MLIATHLVGFGTGGSANETIYTVETNQTEINAFTLLGSPVAAGSFRIIIASGVTVSSNSTSTAALTTGTFPVGSTLTIQNLGTIKGKGGSGGAGDTSGGSGGNAISLGVNVTIENGAGSIWGGGGGGGGGGNAYHFFGETQFTGFGGGGGNGAGPNAQTAGSGGSTGSSGSGQDSTGGSGGSGGDYGASGTAGSSGSAYTSAGSFSNGSPGSGGAAGKAVALNGYTATFTSGSSDPNVKGAVS